MFDKPGERLQRATASLLGRAGVVRAATRGPEGGLEARTPRSDDAFWHGVAAHRAFPLAVAAWFAVLLGLGSLVLPTQFYETVFGAIGLSAVLPAAAPPLGSTARLLIALAATGAGAAIGLVVAGRVAAQGRFDDSLEAASPNRAIADIPPVRPPLKAREELGVDSLDSPFGEPPFLRDEPAQDTVPAPAPNPAEAEDDDPFANWPPSLEDGARDPIGQLSEDWRAEPLADWNEADDGEPETVNPQPAPEPPQEMLANEPADIESEYESEVAPDAALDQLSLAQLVERFSRSLEGYHADPALAAHAPTDEPERSTPVARPELAVDIARTIDESVPELAEDGDEEARIAETGYSSLLAMSRAAPANRDGDAGAGGSASSEPVPAAADPHAKLREALAELEALGRPA